jgi:hypothetical protein
MTTNAKVKRNGKVREVEVDDYSMHPNGYPRIARCMTCDEIRDIGFLEVSPDLSIGVCQRCEVTIRGYELVKMDEAQRRREKRAGRGKKVSTYNRKKTRKV